MQGNRPASGSRPDPLAVPSDASVNGSEPGGKYRPDDDQATAHVDSFFRAIFRNRSGNVCIARKGQRFFDQNFPWPDALSGILYYVNTWNGKQDLYVRAALFDDSGKHTKANITAVPAFYADLDDCHPDRLKVAPSVIVETSLGRYQAWWPSVEDLTVSTAENVNRRIAVAHKDDGCDQSGWDATQALRIPGTHSLKRDAAVKLVTLNGARYRSSDFHDYPELPEPTEANGAPLPDLTAVPSAEKLLSRPEVPDRVRELFATVPSDDAEEGWSGALWELECELAEVGFMPAETLVVARDSACNKYERDGRPLEALWKDVQKAHVKVEKERAATADPTDDARSSWLPVDLDAVLDAAPEPPPSICMRDDGACLFYPGKTHWIQGESESLKTWLVVLASQEQIELGNHVLYFDFEDSAKGITERLQALGCSRDAILRYFHYIQPDEPFRGSAEALAIDSVPTLVIIDGVTEVMTLQGLDAIGEKSNQDVVKLIKLFPQRLAKLGSAVALIDHLTKSRDGRGHYAIGGQHKRNIVTGASYTVDLVRPFGYGQHGIAKISIAKDRPGRVRERDPKVAGTLHLYSEQDRSVRAELKAPFKSEPHAGIAKKPTATMDAVSKLLAETPGLSKTAIVATISGKDAVVRSALEYLVLDGYVEERERKGQGGGKCYFNARPYIDDLVIGDQA